MTQQLKKFKFVIFAMVTLFGLWTFSSNVSAKVIEKTDYQVQTTFKNNNANVANNGSYGDSKFIITPVFSIGDNVHLEVGDQIVYKLPDQLQFDIPIERNMTAPDGMEYAKLKTDTTTKTATITITNTEYFNRFNSGKQIGVDLTVVWDKTVMPVGKPQTFHLEGYGDITLTRVVIDEEPLGISKWGVQRSDDPQIIEWRIRVNRDLNTMTSVFLTDEIPANQELVGPTIRGHYFADFYNGPNTSFNDSNVRISIQDKNHFTIESQDLDGRGMFIYYQTRIIGPVDASSKVYNSVTLETDQRGAVTIPNASAPVSRIGDSAIGEKSLNIPVSTKKILQGRALKEGEFLFQLIDDSNGSVVQTVSNDANGTITFADLILKTAGEHRYRIIEVNDQIPGVAFDPDNDIILTYRVTDTGSSLQLESQTIEREAFVNTYAPSTISIPVRKVWQDNNDQDGKRANVSVSLFEGIRDTGHRVTLTKENNWMASFENIPAYRAGVPIVYNIIEEEVEGYQTVAVVGSAADGFVITNERLPETVDIEVTKKWQDQDNRDGIRPTSITVKLYANGTQVDSKVVQADAAGKWQTTFASKPKYANGQLIQYTVDEEVVAEYEKQITDFTITNTHTPAAVDFAVTKRWDDDSNRDGNRPTSIKVQLYQSIDGAAPTAVPGKTVTLTAANQTDANTWVTSFTNLPKFEAGKEIVYSIAEDTTMLPESYISTVTGQVITNQYTPATISISGVGSFDDVDNQDGKRPSAVTIEVKNGAGQVVATQEIAVGANGEVVFTVDQLPKYTNGQEETYTVTAKAVAAYETTITPDLTNRHYSLVFKHTPVQIPLTGMIVWDDADNKDQIRPNEFQVTLLADGVEVAQQTVSALTNWNYDFGSFDQYKNGVPIQYTVTAQAPQGYDMTIDGFVVRQVHRLADANLPNKTDQTPKQDVTKQTQTTQPAQTKAVVPNQQTTAPAATKQNVELPNTGTPSAFITKIVAIAIALLGVAIVFNDGIVKEK